MNQTQTIALYQPLLHQIAFKLLRCKADAEDIVQDTFLKWLSVDHTKVQNTKSYLITAVKNNCLNHRKTLRKKKEECWDSFDLSQLIEKIKEVEFPHLDVEAEVKKALTLIQEKLGPMERAVYLLKEVFDIDYKALQKILDKKADHCRQMMSRARKKLSEEAPKIKFDLPDKAKILESFKKASDWGNVTDLIQHLKLDIAGALKNKF